MINFKSIRVNHEGISYTLYIQYKDVKNVIFRFHHSFTFFVSAPRRISQAEIRRIFIQEFPRIKKLLLKPEIPFTDFTYVYGEKVALTELASKFNLKSEPTDIRNFYDLMRKQFYAFLLPRVRHFETVMKIEKPHKVRMQYMKTRWGSNSRKTHSVNFNLKVMHFSPAIIDALIVHELAHFYYSNHSKEFYAYLRTIIPAYDELDKKLMRHVYA